MSFISLKVAAPEELQDILISELAELGFDSFLSSDTGFDCSVEKGSFDEDAVDEVFGFYSKQGSLSYTSEEVEKQNWNKLWETNYDMVEITPECLIRAEFHKPDKKYPYEIIITPKMSFGTGHHGTTTVMVQHQLEIDHKGKKVFDAGSGTGILAIMASKLGAAEVTACDIEDWAVLNGKENAEKNGAELDYLQGTAVEHGKKGEYDIVLANINRNIILEELPTYYEMLKPKGHLLVSGFYVEDIPLVVNKAQGLGFSFTNSKSKTNWAGLVLEKG